jgi:hypothetical protein
LENAEEEKKNTPDPAAPVCSKPANAHSSSPRSTVFSLLFFSSAFLLLSINIPAAAAAAAAGLQQQASSKCQAFRLHFVITLPKTTGMLASFIIPFFFFFA